MVIARLQDQEAKMIVDIIESYAESKRDSIDFGFMRELVHLADKFSLKQPVEEKLSYSERHELLKEADCLDCDYLRTKECMGIDRDICKIVADGKE